LSKRALILWTAAGLLGAGGLIVILVFGRTLVAPVPMRIGPIPTDLSGKNVEFPNASGGSNHGWFIPGIPGKGGIILMHRIRSNRLEMLDRARFLRNAGYSVLLFDFQAHGDSPGNKITFGYLESKDAQAALDYIRSQLPSEPIGAIGVSLGGAAALLTESPLLVNALILEAVYPTIEEALENRIAIRLGSLAPALAPLLVWQISLQLGVRPEQLRPIDHIRKVQTPILIIAGTDDQHTTLLQSRRLFETALEPKEFWPIAGARHVNFHQYAGPDYERRVLEFFRRYLS